jgi:hypothetical protein
MGTSDDPTDHGLPTWAKLTLQLGILPAIAAYLVYNLVTLNAGDIKYIRDELDRHAVQVDRLQSQFDDFYQRQEDYLSAQLALMQRVCLNTANDGVERQACLATMPPPPPSRKGGG